MHTGKAKPADSSSRNAKKLSISVLVISLPVLYVSLLHIPPSTLFHDTTFWFLLSNSIIIIVAADFCMSSSSTNQAAAGDLLYDEFIKHWHHGRGRAAFFTVEKPSLETGGDDGDSHKEQEHARSLQAEPVVHMSIVLHERSVKQKLTPADRSVSMKETKTRTDEKSMVKASNTSSATVEEIRPLRRSVTEKRIEYKADNDEDDDEYSNMSIEELNKRVEEFIGRFNREMRLQRRNES